MKFKFYVDDNGPFGRREIKLEVEAAPPPDEYYWCHWMGSACYHDTIVINAPRRILYETLLCYQVSDLKIS